MGRKTKTLTLIQTGQKGHEGTEGAKQGPGHRGQLGGMAQTKPHSVTSTNSPSLLTHTSKKKEKKSSDFTSERSFFFTLGACRRRDSRTDPGKSEIRPQTFHRPGGVPCLKPWRVYVSCLVAGAGQQYSSSWELS